MVYKDIWFLLSEFHINRQSIMLIIQNRFVKRSNRQDLFKNLIFKEVDSNRLSLMCVLKIKNRNDYYR